MIHIDECLIEGEQIFYNIIFFQRANIYLFFYSMIRKKCTPLLFMKKLEFFVCL